MNTMAIPVHGRSTASSSCFVSTSLPRAHHLKTGVACDHIKNFPTGTIVSFDRDSLGYPFDIGNLVSEPVP